MGKVVSALAFIGAGILLGPLGLAGASGLAGTMSASLLAFIGNASVAIGLSVLSSQIFRPKLNNARQRLAGLQTTVRSTTEFRSIVYGQAIVSGPIAYHNLSGGRGQECWYVIPLAWGRSHSVVSVWFDGYEFPAEDIQWTAGANGADGSGAGNVDIDEWKSDDSPPFYAVKVRWALGDDDQVAMAPLVETFQDWTSDHRFRGITYGVAQLTYLLETEEIWEEKQQPTHIKFVLKGRLCYDPRRYALNADNTFQTVGKPVGAGLRWFPNNNRTSELGTDFTVSSETLQHASSSAGFAYSEKFPVDSSKRYYVRARGIQINGTPQEYLGVAFYDAAGANITSSTSPASDATGWDTVSDNHYFEADINFSGLFGAEYGTSFGSGGTASIPSGAVEMALVWIANNSNEASTESHLEDFAVYEIPVGEGGDREYFTLPDTWHWSDNPVVCLFDYMTQVMGVAYNRINWDDAIVAAQACDELVDIPPATTEKRFTCNGAISMGDSHKANIEKILSSGDLQLRWKQGRWSVQASVWEAPTITVDEDWLTDDAINVTGMDGLKERFNTVRGFYIDPERKYEPVEFPEVSVAEYVTRDGGQTLSRDLELHMTNTHTMAQRLGYRLVEKGDNQIVANAKLNANAAQLAIGDRVNVDWWPLGWTYGGNYIPNSADVSTLQKTNVVTTNEGITSSGSTAWQVELSTTGASAGIHFPTDHLPGSHFPGDHVPSTTGGGGGNGNLYADLSSFAQDEGNTFAVEYAPGDMSSQFVTAAVVNMSASPNLILWSGDLDLTDGTISNVSGSAQNYARMVPLPNGWWRLLVYVQADVYDGEDVRFYVLYDASGTEGDTFYVNAPQAIPYINLNPLYIETTGSAIATQPQVMRVIEWKRLDDGRYDVTFKQDEEGDYTDPLVAEYSVYDDGVITTPTIDVAPPTDLTATALQGAIKWEWTDPPSRLYDVIEVWTSEVNDRGSAVLTASVGRSPYIQSQVTNWIPTYTWVRARNFKNDVSDFEPFSAAAGVEGMPLEQEGTLGIPDPDFELSSAFPSPYWELHDSRSGGTGTSPAWDSSITFRDGLGVGGTNAMDLSLSELSNSFVFLQSKSYVRLPFGGCEVRIRYKATSGITGGLAPVLRCFDTIDGTYLGAAVGDQIDPGESPERFFTDGQWHICRWGLNIPPSLNSRMVKLNVRLLIGALSPNIGQGTANDYVRIDYVQLYPVHTISSLVLDYE